MTINETPSKFEPTWLHKILALPVIILMWCGAIIGFIIHPFMYGLNRGKQKSMEFWEFDKE